MAVFILSPDPSDPKLPLLEAKLRRNIPELVRISSVEEIVRDLSKRSNGKVVVLFASPIIEQQSLDRLIQIATQTADRMLLILISDEITTEDYKRLVRTGGADWVATDGAAQEILEIIFRHNATIAPTAHEKGAERAAVVSFVPSAGGVGNTTLALEAGIRTKLAKRSKSRNLCYIDLDFQNSNSCDYLDIEPRLQIHEIAESPERLDAQLFSIFLSHHSSGLDVLAAPRNKLQTSDIGLETLDALFEMAAKQYDTILVDLPVAWYPWTIPIISHSDALIVTGLNTVPCLRQLAEALNGVRKSIRPGIQVVAAINRYKRNVFGRVQRRQHVEQVLQGEKVFYVGEEPLALESINVGTPLATRGGGRHEKRIRCDCRILRRDSDKSNLTGGKYSY